MSHPSTDPQQYHFHKRSSAKISEIAEISDAIADWAEQCAIPVAIINNVILMLDELMTNVVTHGYGDQQDGEMEISLELRDKQVIACLRDQAPAFDPFSIAEADTSLDLEQREIGGLGVHFVRKMADSFAYQRSGDSNEVRFSKKIPV